jgi:hypothetical protein
VANLPARLLPINGINTDLGDSYMPPNMARFIKNLSYVMTDTSEADPSAKGGTGYFKPLEANQIYDPNFVLPGREIDNYSAGRYTSKEEDLVLFLVYNVNADHGLYLIRGSSDTIETVYRKNCLNLQLRPENFLHYGGGWLEVFHFTDPNTDLPRKRSYFIFTDGYNDLRFICLEDSIATGGFDATVFPYFVNPHPECLLINAGVPTPLDCLTVTEVPNDDPAQTNNLRFKTWQFRVKAIDVYGRMSEHGIISDIYIPGKNDCLGSSELLARCLDLSFDAGNPLIDKYQIEFRNCNDEQWYVDNTISLYLGSNLGDWWLRSRNPDFPYDSDTNKITYRFCRDKECNPIAVAETNRTENPLPRQCQSVAKIGRQIGVGDNKRGFNPFSDELMSNISLTVTPPSPQNSTVRNIEIFVPILNIFSLNQQPIYKDTEGRYVWGGFFLNEDRYVANIYDDFKQFFGDADRPGMIGYLAGTQNAAVSELWYVNDNNDFVQIKLPDDLAVIHTAPYNKRYFLKFTFNSVAPAIYNFRIAASTAKLSENYTATSVPVSGSFAWNNKTVDYNTVVDTNKELIVDVCADNYSSLNDNKVLTIIDLTAPFRDANQQPQAFSGYVYERLDNGIFEIPIELLRVQRSSTNAESSYVSPTTDYNGFYFGVVLYPIVHVNPHFDVEIFGNCGCNNYIKLIHYRLDLANNLNQQTLSIQGRAECPNYADSPCNRIIIQGRVTECNTGIPVPGIGVVLSRGQVAVTGADGTFKIIAHDDNYNNSTRVDDIRYVPTTCAFKGCNTDCITPVQVVINKCTDCATRTIDLPDVQLFFQILRGLLSGGKYGVALWPSDWLGRHRFAQTRDFMYVSMPTLNQTQTFAPSSLTLTINPNATFPSEVTKLSVCITKELIMGGVYLDWIVDRVQFIDNTGNENNVAPTQIKIYYGSLVQYNEQNNFNTTTGWQFLNTVRNVDSGLVISESNYTSDYVEFYMNGDGVFFPTLIRALIKYDQTGQYFLIDYDSALKDLKPFALIRLCRPQQCTTQDLFFELCGTIDVVNGKAKQNTIVLNAFDTYYKYRQIPIPVPTDDPEINENVPRTFGFPFEHHSPSDFWGDHCQNIGRPNSRNPYEAEVILPTEVMLSGGISVNGQLNYLNYFDEALATNFNSWNFGGIVSLIPFTGGVLFICEFGTFTVGFDDNLLRQAADGSISVGSGPNLFGRPDSSTISIFGCRLFDKNTIQCKEGRVEFLDTKECVLIQHDFQNPKAVSREVVDSYIQAKIKFVNEWNRTHDNKRYFHGTINPSAKEYILTDFLLGGDEYVNNERKTVISKNDSIVFDYFNKTQDGKYIWRGYYSSTPEQWAYLEGQKDDLQLFAFKKGIPYKYYTQNSDKKYSNFFGVDVDLVVRPVMVIDGFVKKKLTNAQGYCKTLYWCDQLLTDSGQKTRMLKSAWKEGNFYWSAGIRCDLNTPADPNLPVQTGANKIFDGNNMFGSICDARFVVAPPESNSYSELLGFIIEVFQYEKSGGS